MVKTQNVDPEFPFQLDHPAVAEPRPPPPPRIRPDVLLTEAAVLRDLASLTQAEADAISNIPQGTQAWLNARKNRITASNFAAAIGRNKYKSPKGLLKDLLWNTFKGNAATRWGSEHEDIARDAYIAHMQGEIDAGRSEYTSIRVEESGLHVIPERPWLGSSPDGVVHVTRADGTSHQFLLEIKCPFRKQFYDPPVPTYYNCQIQGVMANMGLPYCDFVVWIPSGIQITHVPFDTEFWENTLLPGLHNFFHKIYLPLIVAKYNGELEEGETSVVLRLG